MTAGDKLGPYEILALIGKGGMGEVYRARDTKLKRDVALKVLPDVFARDPERMARFEREAQVLASLNHPNIATIYGVEERALAMELVEGESPQGPLPFDDAWKIASQIADALEYAHEKGVIHRDLKPANVKVTPDGVVKLLDFGLAKALSGTPEASGSDPSNSPTVTLGATVAGTIMGTAAYMAPEQAKGKKVDKRADIWSWGVVLYELLTGDRLFKGDDAADTLAQVLTKEADLDRVPLRVRKLLRRCLEQDPRQRLRDIGEARHLLEGKAGATLQPERLHHKRLPWAVAAGFMAVSSALTFAYLRRPAPDEHPLRLTVPLPENSSVGFLELSPDGRRLLLSLIREGKWQMYLRPLGSDDLQLLPGPNGARTPFWSPDSRFIGFFSGGSLKVIPAAGGPEQVLCTDTGMGRGGTWSRRGVILFATESGGLRRVDAKGGPCSAVSKDDPNVQTELPVFLPDGHHYFYVRESRDSTSSGVYLATLDEPTGHRVLADFSSVVYTPPVSAGARAHLLFLRGDSLMAQPFDDTNLQPVGDPFSIAARGSNSMTPPQVEASAAADGTLVYLAGQSRLSQFTWYDRNGKRLGTVGPAITQVGVALSPDANSVTSLRYLNGSGSLWLYDLARGSESRVTPPGASTDGNGVVWSPDGNLLWFNMEGPEGHGLYQADLKGGPLHLVERSDPAAPAQAPSDRSRDGKLLVYTKIDPRTQGDIWYAPVESGKPLFKNAVKFLGTDAVSQGQLSPDGKWLAYGSTEAGGYKLRIRPFPTGSGVWQVSNSGEIAFEPRWSSDGKELYYLNTPAVGHNTLMVVDVEASRRGVLRISPPRKLFDVHVNTIVAQDNVFSYSPAPDGKRFLVNSLVEAGESTVNIITNWQKAAAEHPAQR